MPTAPCSHTSPSLVSTIPDVPLYWASVSAQDRPQAAVSEQRQSQLASHPHVIAPDVDGEHVADVQPVLGGVEPDLAALEQGHPVAGIAEPGSSGVIGGEHDGRLPRQVGQVAEEHPLIAGPPEHAAAHDGDPQVSGGVLGDRLDPRRTDVREAHRLEPSSGGPPEPEGSTDPDDPGAVAIGHFDLPVHLGKLGGALTRLGAGGGLVSRPRPRRNPPMPAQCSPPTRPAPLG